MRLTERKTIYPKCDKQGNLTKVDYIEIKNKGLAEEKLCQLEDVEEKLGIDLITLFKALEDGVYYLNKQKELRWCQSRNLVISQKSLRVYRHHYKLFKDYGKTWALTKEELL